MLHCGRQATMLNLTVWLRVSISQVMSRPSVVTLVLTCQYLAPTRVPYGNALHFPTLERTVATFAFIFMEAVLYIMPIRRNENGRIEICRRYSNISSYTRIHVCLSRFRDNDNDLYYEILRANLYVLAWSVCTCLICSYLYMLKDI